MKFLLIQFLFVDIFAGIRVTFVMALFATILFASLIEVKHIDKAIQIDQILDLIVLGLLDVLGADVVIWFSLGFNLFGRIAVEVVYAYDVESVN